jgi:hypothetical protein
MGTGSISPAVSEMVACPRFGVPDSPPRSMEPSTRFWMLPWAGGPCLSPPPCGIFGPNQVHTGCEGARGVGTPSQRAGASWDPGRIGRPPPSPPSRGPNGLAVSGPSRLRRSLNRYLEGRIGAAARDLWHRRPAGECYSFTGEPLVSHAPPPVRIERAAPWARPIRVVPRANHQRLVSEGRRAVSVVTSSCIFVCLVSSW